jgi:hypothetical protein
MKGFAVGSTAAGGYLGARKPGKPGWQHQGPRGIHYGFANSCLTSEFLLC